jgi:nucleotide-binding universal stress UspA family protein
MNRIVIGVDGSAGATAAVEEGVELAQEVGARVTFVHVRPALPLFGDPYYQRKLSEQLRHAREVVDEALAAAAEHDVPADSDILDGNVANAIIEIARGREADLIVVGSRGHGALASALLGSVSRALVERSPLPVMIVREHARTPA